MLKDLTYTLPKRRKVRQAFGFKEVSDALALWLEVSEVDRIKLRKRKFSAWVRKACSDSKMDKSICFHDLRHCYAINLLNRGISMSRVAMCLGNDEGVCKRHYTGYSISQEGLDILAETVSKHDF